MTLGEIDLPSGSLLILDPGLASYWSTDRDRARLAAAVGGGVAVVTYGGLWEAVVVGGLPADRPVQVVATPMPAGEFTGRWRSVDVVVDPATDPVDTATVHGVTVEHGMLLCADLDAFAWPDAPANPERIAPAIAAGDGRAATVPLPGARGCGFDNRWGDGIFAVARDMGPAGELLRVRLDVGSEETQQRMRAVRLRCFEAALVSSQVWDGGEPPRFLERDDPSRPEDSGWVLFAGTESDEFAGDPANYRIVQVGLLIERYPPLADVIDAPVGSRFQLQGPAYIPG